MTSYRKFSFKDNNAAWKARRQASNERFYSAQYTAANIYNVGNLKAAGQVQLTMQQMTARFQQELSAKAEERASKLDELYGGLDKTV
ncbi:hypothetical protein D1F64_17515 [Breoghania sp. L-A4]|nr:hypothetical protein D1F64_17515 [Breoghania sp. L-A4]